MTDDIKSLYNALRDKGYSQEEIGNEAEFRELISNDNDRKYIYNYVKSKGDSLGDYYTYEKRMTGAYEEATPQRHQEKRTQEEFDNSFGVIGADPRIPMSNVPKEKKSTSGSITVKRKGYKDDGNNREVYEQNGKTTETAIPLYRENIGVDAFGNVKERGTFSLNTVQPKKVKQGNQSDITDETQLRIPTDEEFEELSGEYNGLNYNIYTPFDKDKVETAVEAIKEEQELYYKKNPLTTSGADHFGFGVANYLNALADGINPEQVDDEIERGSKSLLNGEPINQYDKRTMYNAQNHYLEKAREIADKYEKGFWSGVGNAADNALADLGGKTNASNKAAATVLYAYSTETQRLTKELEQQGISQAEAQQEAAAQTFAKLPKEAQLTLQSYLTYSDNLAIAANDPTLTQRLANKVGETIGVSFIYMADFMINAALTGGITGGIRSLAAQGVKAATKNVGKNIAKQALKRGVPKEVIIAADKAGRFAVNTAGDVAKSIPMTLTPNAQQRRQEVRLAAAEQGQLADPKDIRREELRSGIEAWTEIGGGRLLGTMFSKGIFGGATKAAKAINPPLPAKIKSVADNLLTKSSTAAERLGLNSFAEEFGEEILNPVAEAVIGNALGDEQMRAAWEEQFAEDDAAATLILSLAGSILPMHGVRVGAEHIKHKVDTRKYNKAKEDFRVAAGENFNSSDLFKAIDSGVISIALSNDKTERTELSSALIETLYTVAEDLQNVGNSEAVEALGKYNEAINRLANDLSLAQREVKDMTQRQRRRLFDDYTNHLLGKAKEGAAYYFYNQGYNTTDPAEMNRLQTEYEARREVVSNLVTPEFLAQIDQNPRLVLHTVENNESWTSEQKQQIFDYINSKQAYDGIIQAARDDIDGRVEESNAVVDSRTNQNSGMVQRAILKTDDRPVYIVGGNIALNDDGTIDTQNSDGSIVIKDEATGNLEFLSPSYILSADPVQDPNELKAATAEQIRQSVAQERLNAINGTITVFNAGDTYNIIGQDGQTVQVVVAPNEQGVIDNGDGTVNVQIGNEVLPMPKEQIQASVDSERKAAAKAAIQPKSRYKYNYQQEGIVYLRDENGNVIRGEIENISPEGHPFITTDQPYNGKVAQPIPYADLDRNVVSYYDNAEAEAAQQEANPQVEMPQAQEVASSEMEQTTEQPTETQPAQPEQATETQTALKRIPKDKNGEAIYEQAETPELAWDALLEQTEGDTEMAMAVATSMLEDKEKALQKLEKSAPKAGKSVSEKIAAVKEHNAKIEQARAEVEAWKAIIQTPARRAEATEAERERQAAEKAAEIQAQQAAERAEREEYARLEREALNGVPDWVEDNPKDSRARGYRRVSGEKIDRQEPLQAVQGKEVAVKFSNDKTQNGRVALIDARELQPSHLQGVRNPAHFIDEAQPKERTDETSVVTAQKIAENIRGEEITSSVTAYTGAPTVNSRGEVIQGNNRSDALRYMWEHNPEQAEIYRQYLKDHAEEFGLTAEQIGQMEMPVLVNMADVTDSEAIELGQYSAQDTESGGVERIKANVLVTKLGSNMGAFANKLLQTADEEMTISQLIDKNGAETLSWLAKGGYISATQYQSAFDGKGLTAEAKNDLQGVLYQIVFQGASPALRDMFVKLPVKAQRAILATAYRDYESPASERMLDELQASIIAYYNLSLYEDFANAKSKEETKKAIDSWKTQLQFDDISGESFLPAEKFSNFALELAYSYKALLQKTIQERLNNIFDLVQGKSSGDLFNEAETEPITLAEAIKKVLNIDYNGKSRSNVLGSDATTEEQGERGGSRGYRDREQTKSGERTSDDRGRTESDSGERGETETHSVSSQDKIRLVDPRQMSDEEKQRRGDMLRNTPAIEVEENQITATDEMSARKVAEQWWEDNFEAPIFFDTEVGEVEINKRSIESSLAHRYSQKKLDAITSLAEGFENAVYLGSMPDFSRQDGVTNHFFAYPIVYNGEVNYVFCRAMQDTNKNRLYVHEVFIADKIKKGNTLQTAAFQPHGGIALYRDVLANVLEEQSMQKLKETVAKTEPQQPNNANSSGSSLSDSAEIGITQSKPNSESSVSEGKDTTNSLTNNERAQEIDNRIAELEAQQGEGDIFNIAERTVEIDNLKREKQALEVEQEAKQSEIPTSSEQEPQFDRRENVVQPQMSEEQREVFEAVSEMLSETGVPVEVVSNEEIELLAEQGGTRTSKGKKITPETDSVQKEHLRTAISSVEGAKIAKNLDTLAKAVKTIRNWLKNDTRNKAFELKLPKRTSELVRKAMGQDFDSHNITANSLAHTLKNHGENGTKLQPNSIPLRKEDMELIPYIMTAPDYVTKGTPESGRESIRFYKTLSNGYVVVVEKEQKDSPDDMDTITMWAELSSSNVTDARGKTSSPMYHAQDVIISSDDIAKIRKDAEAAIEENEKITDKIKFLKNGKGIIYGATFGGKIYLNGSVLNPESPIHEYTHLWDDTCRKTNPELWKRGVELMKQTPLWEEVKNDPNYSNLETDDEIASEVHSRLTGRDGAKRLEEMVSQAKSKGIVETAEAVTLREQIRQWLQDFWWWLKDTMSAWTKEEAAKVSLEDFINMPLKDLAQGRKLQGEDDIRLMALTPEVQAETERIKAEALANGTFMKAPNGKDTNLDERNWLLVRTKNFKNWFGDWELAATEVLKVVGNANHDFKSFDEAKTWAKENIVGVLSNEQTNGKGEINISGKAVEKYLSQKAVQKSENKDVHLSALKVLPEIIKQSVIAETHKDRANNSNIKDIQRLYGCLTIDGKDYRVKTTVKRYNSSNEKSKAYSYEVTEIELLEGSSIPHTQSADSMPTSNNSISVAKLLNNVESDSRKGEKLLDYSKVVDENGEPLVVYHGTNNVETKRKWNDKTKTYDMEYSDFTVFRRSNDGVENSGHFFNNDIDNAGGYGSHIYDVLLKLTNPLVIDCNGSFYSSITHDGQEMDTYEWAQYAEQNGYDGVIFKNIRDGVDYGDLQQLSDDYVAFSPNQIKSATANNGEFSKEDDDIRFRQGVNEQFNYELQQQIEGVLSKGHIYKLGYPSEVLQSAGVPNLPIELAASRLQSKATQANHQFDLSDVQDLPNAIQRPIAVFDSARDNVSKVILTELKQGNNNFVAVLRLREDENGLSADINSIKSLYPKDGTTGVISWINKGLLRYADKQKLTDFITQSTNLIAGNEIGNAAELKSKQRINLADVENQLDSVAKVVKDFENPPLPSEKSNLPIGDKQIAQHVESLAKKLNLDNVEILTSTEGLDERHKSAKGFFNIRTGKITIVVPNNDSIEDVEQTLLHEAVAHRGLRELFGERFEIFLDNVFNNASIEVRRKIADLMTRNGWDYLKATEEYLASLAETTNFEEAQKSGWWQKIKDFFSEMLERLGFEGFKGAEITDNELRYILWRSYENLKGGRNSSVFAIAEDTVKQNELKVGQFEESKGEEDLFRKGTPKEYREGRARDKYERMMKKRSFRSGETFQDSMLSSKVAMRLILGKKKSDFNVEDVEDYENAYIGENRLSSVNKSDAFVASRDWFKPLYELITKIAPDGKTREELVSYMFAKHGLERNERMRREEAQE